MLELEGKKLSYQHPDLKQLESKREAAYFLHRQVSLPWIQKCFFRRDTSRLHCHAHTMEISTDQAANGKLINSLLRKFEISRGVKLRSLKLLEKAGLIQLSKASGKSLKITLFPYPTKQNLMDPYHRGVITEPPYLFFLPPLIDLHTESNLVTSHLIAY